MPSTTRATLKNLFRPFARSATINLDKAESHIVACIDVSLDATTDVAERALFVANGPVYVKRIFFVPTATSAGHASNNRAIVIKNKGSAHNGTTALVTYTTTASPDNGFVAFTPKDLYAPVSPGLALPNGATLSYTNTHGSSGVAMSGLLFVEYTPIID